MNGEDLEWTWEKYNGFPFAIFGCWKTGDLECHFWFSLQVWTLLLPFFVLASKSTNKPRLDRHFWFSLYASKFSLFLYSFFAHVYTNRSRSRISRWDDLYFVKILLNVWFLYINLCSKLLKMLRDLNNFARHNSKGIFLGLPMGFTCY